MSSMRIDLFHFVSSLISSGLISGGGGGGKKKVGIGQGSGWCLLPPWWIEGSPVRCCPFARPAIRDEGEIASNDVLIIQCGVTFGVPSNFNGAVPTRSSGDQNDPVAPPGCFNQLVVHVNV